MHLENSSSSSFSVVSLREVLQTLTGILLLAASAQIVIPIAPVPVTLQSVAVMLIGFTFATRPALISVAAYLFAGTLGLPIFSSGGFGVARIAGPAGGYLFGFFLAVFVMTMIRRNLRSGSLVGTMLICALGTACIFVPGIFWLSTFVGFSAAITTGLLPFLLPGAVKTVLLSLSLQYLGKAKRSY